jgi:uncharacterized membrane protein
MGGKPVTENERRMDETIAGILRLGVSAAAILAIIGLAIYLKNSGGATPDYHTFHAAKVPKGWLQAGILMLILTPVARVVFSVYAFARERDVSYVVITLIVLALLVAGWFTGYGA